MSRSYRFDPDDVPAPRTCKKQDRIKREARKGDFFTPARVTRDTRNASTRSVVEASGRSD